MQGASRMMKSCPSSPVVVADLPTWEVTKVVVEVSVAKVPMVATVEWVGGPSHRLDVLTIGSNV